MIVYEKADAYFERKKDDIISEIVYGLNIQKRFDERFNFTLYDVEIIELGINEDNNTAEACFEGILREESVDCSNFDQHYKECTDPVQFEVTLEEDNEGNIAYVLPRNSEGVVYSNGLIKYKEPDPMWDYYPD
ncbi:hypothetical protein [Butyrivibrio sp. WCE2006]|uniref:hypothetical protein n=1 Tax=Butyrivibrio sp. WCE2006 TaxID=1410611 RepID=UPI0005D2A0F8|nr:hypothetical protein [Butyrivibrio sp. WCE2006]